MTSSIKDIINPFPGLRPFEQHEHHLFFGREEQTHELRRKLNRTRFLAIVGTSGSGKSSLIRAGFVPTLEKNAQWHVTLSGGTIGIAERLAETVDAFITSRQVLCSRTSWDTRC